MSLYARTRVLSGLPKLRPTLRRMASTRTTTQPPWAAPHGQTLHPDLKVYNSLTRSKEPFVPRDPEGRRVTWYSCGPTVYDDAHLGHARNYVSIDILRRLLKDYFKFDVHFVMNITDIDDKIILEGRKQYLYEEYQKVHKYIDDEVTRDVREAWQTYVQKFLSGVKEPHLEGIETQALAAYANVLVPTNGKVSDAGAKIKLHINNAARTAKALMTYPPNLTPYAFYDLVKDVMCLTLDAKHGSSVTDHNIFLKLTRKFEERFFKDMDDLNVWRPDELVRVTEYNEQIASFVDKIVQNKFAYATSEGSVYFDIKAFEAAGNHYARLEPWNRSDQALQADGEGALSQRTSEKRSDADFALWKASKPGEPSWKSTWGPGRPGWHIECSAMASDKLGSQMDIHSGGIDLAFPHHDNELAQSEAYWQSGKQWVNYFIHMGHLSIQGSKMSKSLKNFTTIRIALERKDWTSRSLRIVFLLGSWRDGIEITDDLVKEGAAWEDRVDNFFINAIDAINSSRQSPSRPNASLEQELGMTERKVHQALLDSFNTAAAMAAISNLITAYNTADKSTLPHDAVRGTAIFVTRMVNIFGLNGNALPEPREIGWDGLEVPERALVDQLAAMRDQLRQAAISKAISPKVVDQIVTSYPPPPEPQATTGRKRPKTVANVISDFHQNAVAASRSDHAAPSSEASKEILALCDRVRDVDLWDLNVYLEDRDNAPALVRPVTNGLRNARKEKDDRARLREEAKRKREQEAQAKLEKGRISPTSMFKPPIIDDYAEWTEEGLPTKMKNGERVSDSRAKKLKKLWEIQKKAHEAWLSATDGVQNGTSQRAR